jgi:hypothetical protein
MQAGKPIPRERLNAKLNRVTLRRSFRLTKRDADGNKIPAIIHAERNRVLSPNLFEM